MDTEYFGQAYIATVTRKPGSSLDLVEPSRIASMFEGLFQTKGAELLGKKNTFGKTHPGWHEEGHGNSDFETRGQS